MASRRPPRWLSAGGLLLAGIASAQLSPNGPDFQVNTYSSGSQELPSVAADDRGGFVVVWQSSGSPGTDASGWSVQARRFDPWGTPAGPQVQVNSYTTGDQTRPAVAYDGQGGFVVVWESYPGDPASVETIQARRLDGTGAPAGPEFQVAPVAAGVQHLPTVAADAQGRFVVAWTAGEIRATYEFSPGIWARRFDAAGAPLGAAMEVNSYRTGDQKSPRVAVDGDGNFFVAWQSRGSAGSDQNGESVHAQRFDASGTRTGGESQVNTYTVIDQVLPAVAPYGPGDFVVAWQSYGSDGPDAFDYCIEAQRYDASGAPLGDEMHVNSYTTNGQVRPTVAGTADGGFVVAWGSYGSYGPDTVAYSVQGQRFDAAGVPLGPQFQVNSYTTGYQWRPAAAMDPRGNFVIAWENYPSGGVQDIYARRFDALFRDGFESGDTTRWSSITP